MKNKLLALMTVLMAFGLSLPIMAQNYTKYLFVYFPSNSNENIYYALSDKESPFDFVPMNNGQIMVSADTIALKRGVRDPHVLRGEDGWFYMVNTDMRCAEGWDSNRGIVMMRSHDLVNWQHSTVHFPEKYKGTNYANVTRVWAPETIWDPEAGKYMVYFSLLTNDGTIPYDKVFYCYANADFTDLEGEPIFLFDRGSATIDMDIVYNEKDQLYHAFYKNEGSGGICKVTSSRLTAEPGKKPGSQWGRPSSTLQQTNVAVEGGGVWRLIDSDTWILMYDCYNSGYYQFCESTDLTNFTLRAQTNTSGMFTPRHGTVLAVTDAEVEAIEKSINDKLMAQLLQQLSSEIATAELIGGIDVTSARQLIEKPDLTKNQVTAELERLKVAEYDVVINNYTVDCTQLLGKWKMQNVTSTMRGQHWDGTSRSTYYEQRDGWAGNEWQMSMSQEASLPVGDYVLMAACRSASENVDAQVRVNETAMHFPTNGDTGRGISTDGKANFDTSANYANNNIGRGWEWRYVPFTVTDSTPVEIAFSGSVENSMNQWMSFTSISLLTRDATSLSSPLSEGTCHSARKSISRGNSPQSRSYTLDGRQATHHSKGVVIRQP